MEPKETYIPDKLKLQIMESEFDQAIYQTYILFLLYCAHDILQLCICESVLVTTLT